MINAPRTGAYISRLRKAKDWTQLDLAERLHVTHQAVSQWENGSSMPDVSLLQPLSRLLGVSVDDLLEGEPAGQARGRVTRGAIVDQLAQGRAQDAARLITEDSEGMDMLLDTAPLARPSQLNEVVGHLAGFEFTLDQIVRLAPFVSQAALQSLADGAAVEHIDAEHLLGLAPFVGSEQLDRLVPRVAGGPLSLGQVAELAPFLSDALLPQLVAGCLKAGQPLTLEHLQHLAPFSDERTLAALLEHLPAGPLPIEFVVDVAPFAGEATLDRLIERLDDQAAVGDYLEDLAPHLSQAGLRRAVAQLPAGLTAQQLVDLAPFLDQETMEAVLHQGVNKRKS